MDSRSCSPRYHVFSGCFTRRRGRIGWPWLDLDWDPSSPGLGFPWPHTLGRPGWSLVPRPWTSLCYWPHGSATHTFGFCHFLHAGVVFLAGRTTPVGQVALAWLWRFPWFPAGSRPWYGGLSWAFVSPLIVTGLAFGLVPGKHQAPSVRAVSLRNDTKPSVLLLFRQLAKELPTIVSVIRSILDDSMCL